MILNYWLGIENGYKILDNKFPFQAKIQLQCYNKCLNFYFALWIHSDPIIIDFFITFKSIDCLYSIVPCTM